MLKFAFSDQVVMDAYADPNEAKYNPESEDAKKAGEQFSRTVRAAKNVIKKSGDFLYVRTRAIGAMEKWGPNMNGDAFPMKELQASYRTFVGKGNFIDHKSDDITKIRGLVIDAYLNNDDNCVECLIAVDRKSHPQLARDIETGVVNSVSMGTRVGWSTCSVCDNVARTENDYCSHIKNYKGMKIGFLTNNDKHAFGKFAVHEVNHELEFIELSWVAVPAFQDAYVLEKVASLKKALDNGFDTSKDYGFDKGADRYNTNPELSEDEKSIIAFAGANVKKLKAERGEVIQSQSFGAQSTLNSIAEAAACKEEECSFDARKTATSKPQVTAAGAEMSRVSIVREEMNFRTVPKDFGAKGSVSIDGKDFKWWGASTDKTTWHINLEEGLMSLSANGQTQIASAIEEMISKNVDNTEIIVSSTKRGFNKEGYLQNAEPKPSPEANTWDKVLDKGDRVYNPESLETEAGKPVRDLELEAYSRTAKEGPSGALGKPLGKNDLTLKEEEFKQKVELKRAFIDYLVRSKKVQS